jgi:hypothetical protein
MNYYKVKNGKVHIMELDNTSDYMKTLGQVYTRKPSSKIALSVIDKYERGIL